MTSLHKATCCVLHKNSIFCESCSPHVDSFRYRTATIPARLISPHRGKDSKGIHTAGVPVLNQAEFQTLHVYLPQHPLPSLQHMTARLWDGKPVSVLTQGWQGCKAGGTEPPCLQPLWRLGKAGFSSGRWLRLHAAQAPSFCIFFFLVPILNIVNMGLHCSIPEFQPSSQVDSPTWSCSFPVLSLT